MRKLNRTRLVLAVAAVCFVVVATLITLKAVARPGPLHRPAPTTPDGALDELRAGNARFVTSHRTLSTDTAHDAEDRRELAKGQHPFVAMLCCADSRVCPEFIFDQRPGSVFEIRNAGNLVDDDVMASLEYAVEHLHVPLIMVLGHKGCGAIEAVHQAGDKPLHDHLRALQDHTVCIRQQLRETRDRHTPDVLNQLARDNTRGQALTLLAESAPVKSAVTSGHVRVVCGIYDMETGEVEFFDAR
jgi:carbonic anhydrase